MAASGRSGDGAGVALKDAVAAPTIDTMPRWLHKLASCPGDITKVWTIQQLNLACDFQIVFNNSEMGHLLTGSEDGIWDNLREIKIHIQGAVNTFNNHVSGFPLPGEETLESFAYSNFGVSLMTLLRPTCQRAFGEHAEGKLVVVEDALVSLDLVCQQPDRPVKADASMSNSTLIQSFLHFMTVTCALWTELACHTSSMTSQCHESTVALVPQLRETVKFETARRIFYSLPDQLTKGAGGMLAGLMEDTLEVYDLGVELLSYKAKAGLPMEETLGYAAFTKFYGAAKKLANTSLAQLKEEGLETSFNEEKWAVAAKEGLVIYMRGEPMALNLPPDLLERMMDYVIHVLVTLALLVESPDAQTVLSFIGKRHLPTAGSGDVFSQKKAQGAFAPSLTAGAESAPKSNPKGASDWATMPWLKERRAERASARAAKAQEVAAVVNAQGDENPDGGLVPTLDGHAASLLAAQGKGPDKPQDAFLFMPKGGQIFSGQNYSTQLEPPSISSQNFSGHNYSTQLEPPSSSSQIFSGQNYSTQLEPPSMSSRLVGLDPAALVAAVEKCSMDGANPSEMAALFHRCWDEPSIDQQWLKGHMAAFRKAFAARVKARDGAGSDKGLGPALRKGHIAGPPAAQGDEPAEAADAAPSKAAAHWRPKGRHPSGARDATGSEARGKWSSKAEHDGPADPRAEKAGIKVE